MTNPIAVSQRARELFILLMGLDATDDFESIRNGAYDHWKKMQAVARFEAEIRADERETAAKVAEDHGYSIEISKWMANMLGFGEASR